MCLQESTAAPDDVASEPKRKRVKQEKVDNGEGSSRVRQTPHALAAMADPRATQDPPPLPYPGGPRRKDGKKTYTEPPPPVGHKWKHGSLEYMLKEQNVGHYMKRAVVSLIRCTDLSRPSARSASPRKGTAMLRYPGGDSHAMHARPATTSVFRAARL